VDAACELPEFSLKITESSIKTFGGDKPVTIELEIECAVVNIPETNSTKRKKHKQVSLGMTGILTLTSDNEFIDFRRIP
jgi:ATP-dependent DNA helicase HFM1/MER3